MAGDRMTITSKSYRCTKCYKSPSISLDSVKFGNFILSISLSASSTSGVDEVQCNTLVRLAKLNSSGRAVRFMHGVLIINLRLGGRGMSLET